MVPPFQPQWYRDYFLSTNGGVGAYWFKQSNGNCWFEGDVLGWYEFSVLPDFTNRDAIAEAGIRDADAQTGWSIKERYDTAIIFLARAGNAGSNAGALAIVPALSPRLAGRVVLDTNSPFDFTAHEIGHALNLNHSFDDTNSNYGGKPGEYGHRYCIMSAQAYGGTNPTWTPTGGAPLPIAMQRIGPV